MDLMDLTPKTDKIKIELVHPVDGKPVVNEDGSQMTIELYAQHSKEYKEVLYVKQDKLLALSQKEGGIKYTAKRSQEDALDLMASVTCSWNITYDGGKPELTKSKAKEVYDKVFWIKDQIDVGISEAEVFTKG
tara:strand:+ start:1503 stop:1901 length:399 start_codon:yes stop_codon:yes gene_type:complete